MQWNAETKDRIEARLAAKENSLAPYACKSAQAIRFHEALEDLRTFSTIPIRLFILIATAATSTRRRSFTWSKTITLRTACCTCNWWRKSQEPSGVS